MFLSKDNKICNRETFKSTLNLYVYFLAIADTRKTKDKLKRSWRLELVDAKRRNEIHFFLHNRPDSRHLLSDFSLNKTFPETPSACAFFFLQSWSEFWFGIQSLRTEDISCNRMHLENNQKTMKKIVCIILCSCGVFKKNLNEKKGIN